jgi:hypothetical protein
VIGASPGGFGTKTWFGGRLQVSLRRKYLAGFVGFVGIPSS